MRIEKVQQKDSEIARTVLRYGALIAPMSMTLYQTMIYFEVLPINNANFQPSILTIVIISALWLALGITTFLTKQPKKPFIKYLEVVGYFSLAVMQTWLISGVISPFTSYWVLLFVATYLLLGTNGLRMGYLIFIITLTVDAFLLNHSELKWILSNAITFAAITITTYVIVRIYTSQRISYLDLISSQIREENERNQNITLINNLVDAVISTDHNGLITAHNSAALNLLDTNHSIDGKYISDILDLEVKDNGKLDVFKELSKDASIRKRDDLVMLLSDSDQLRLEATFAPVQSNDSQLDKPDNYVLILRDITRLKSLEEERDEFISVVSHELRTPVAIAEGALSNAEFIAKRDKLPDIVKNISDAYKQIIFLAKMVNDLSTLSRAERGLSDEAELIDVIELAHQLHKQYSDSAEEKNLRFNLDLIGAPNKINTSRLYLQELLQNLITNAIKYTREGSVTLHISQQKDHIKFVVKDTGIGIGKSDLKKIFSRFYRAEDYRTRETTGTGLGLYVSSKLAKKIGCTINVESRLNHGSEFSFSISTALKQRTKK